MSDETCECCKDDEITYQSALLGKDTKGICRDCFDGWYEWGITNKEMIGFRTKLHRTGMDHNEISAALKQRYSEQ